MSSVQLLPVGIVGRLAQLGEERIRPVGRHPQGEAGVARAVGAVAGARHALEEAITAEGGGLPLHMGQIILIGLGLHRQADGADQLALGIRLPRGRGGGQGRGLPIGSCS